MGDQTAPRDLPRPSRELLTAPGIGTYAGILETFNHIVLSDARYLRRLARSGPPWVDSDPGAVDPKGIDIHELHSRVEETERLWDKLLSEAFDAERVNILDGGRTGPTPGCWSRRRLTTGPLTG